MAGSVAIFITLLHQYYLTYEPQFDDRLKMPAFCGFELWLFQNLDRLYSLNSQPSYKEYRRLEGIQRMA